MKKSISLIVLCLGFLGASAFAEAPKTDTILEKKLSFQAVQPEAVLDKAQAQVRLFVENYDVQLDAATKVVSPKQVGGTEAEPTLKESFQKCIGLLCSKTDLDMGFKLNKVVGPCTFNFVLVGDIRRSSQLLSNLYSEINTSLCVTKTATGAETYMKIYLVRADKYSEGTIQMAAFKFINNQTTALVSAFKKTVLQLGVVDVKELN